ncbi:hypothetical protein ACTXG6_10235 [Pseudonocardia sp. Cha107L01]|jgi:hypothetical protein|uniref:hypothetical protein n=1 Tax=Pseudonocardia sp. Cha107L01 TaxID=3457576 RepID=UPI00403E5880
MQRRTRIALAITAAAGAALLGTGTAFADGFTDILGGADTSQASTATDSGSTDADSSDSGSDSSDADSSDSGSDSSDSDSSDDSSDD